MSDEIRKRVTRGVAWIGLASSAVGVLDALALALLLKFWVSEEQLGTVTLAAFLFPLLDVAADAGMSSSVIQREATDAKTLSSVFWLNLGFTLLLFAGLSVAAPVYAHFRGIAILGPLIIAYASKLVVQNFFIIPWALMRRELRFKELSVIRIIANLAEFAGKIGFAAAGYPVWCFVLGPLARILVTGIGVQLRHPWRPLLSFELSRAAGHFRFGLKNSASQMLFHFYSNIDYLIVDAFFGRAALGLYRAAFEIVLYPVKFISEVVVQIAFPAFAKLRSRREELITQFLSFTRQNLAIVTPMLAIFVVEADDVLMAIDEKWVPAAMAVRIFCAAGVLRGLSHIFPPLLDGLGRPGLTLVYTLVASVAMPAAFAAYAGLLGPRLGFLSVALAWSTAYPLAFLVLAWMGLVRLGLSVGAYVRRVGTMILWAVAALGPGLGTRWALAGAPWSVRLVATGAVILVTIGLLFARLEGISIRGAIRGLKGS